MDGLLETMRQNWLWVAGLVTLLGNLALLALSQRFALKSDIQGLAKRVDHLETETVLIAERMRHMPTSDDMKALQAGLAAQNASIEKLNARTEAQGGTLASISDQLAMLTSHLLRSDK